MAAQRPIGKRPISVGKAEGLVHAEKPNGDEGSVRDSGMVMIPEHIVQTSTASTSIMRTRWERPGNTAK